MRLLGLVVGVCLLCQAARAGAAPPLYRDDGPTRRESTRASAAMVEARRERGLDRPEQARATTSGTYKAVVILLQFTDHPGDTINHTPAAFADLLFSVGTHPTGSLRDYYREVSQGKFDIDGIVTRWYTAPQVYSYYAFGGKGWGPLPNNAQQMALDAVQLADPDVDFSQFDNDGPDGVPNSGDDDGLIDALFVVHAGPGGEETTSPDDIWSLKWTLPFSFPTQDGGIRAFAFTTEPEEFGLTTPYSTAGELMSIGVFCHEFGHVLGLPDLYDTTDSDFATEGIGDWDLMATGVYTHRPGEPAGSSPAHMSAWSKIRLGWIEPTWVLQDSAGVTVPPVETSGTVFRLWTNGEDQGEYFLVENRQPIGFDAGLVRSSIESGDGPAHGLLIYHVDDGIVGNENAAHKQVDVEEAGGPEIGLGFPGVQNLDIHTGLSQPQSACGATPEVEGNRGDRFDPWPGPHNAVSFDPGSCPGSTRYCANTPSQVAVRNMVETSGNVTADFFVNGVALRRLAIAVDDSPFNGVPNNGNGFAEPGETVRIRIPLQNDGFGPTGPLTARLAPGAFLAIDPDSIVYGSIPGGGVDSGTVVEATVLTSPDPIGANLSLSVLGAAGLVDRDSVQVLLGTRTGICDHFENTVRRWIGVAVGCTGANEWHREAGINHTQNGTWAWRLGPEGPIGNYAPSQDARLVSQPVRIQGLNDTLTFWQRYDTELGLDGLSLEISTDGGESWTLIQPVGGYSNGDRWTGTQLDFAEVKAPLTGYSGIVQIAFRFRSSPSDEGAGWWIDDVFVTGDDECTTTGVAITRFDAAPAVGRAAVRLSWRLAEEVGSALGIDRALGPAPRERIATLPWDAESGEYEDGGVLAGLTYAYWLTASRVGEPDEVAGPVLVGVPAGPGVPPRVLAVGRIRPNPFSLHAAFSVSLDRDGPYRVRVYRADGSLVRTLADSHGRAGISPFIWNGTDDRGNPVAAGLYFFELRSGGRVRVQKAVLLK